MSAPPPTPDDVVRAYVTTARGHGAGLPLALVRTRSWAGREVLARLVDEQLGAAGLDQLARDYLHAQTPDLTHRLSEPAAAWACEYAFVTAVQRGEPADHEVARGLLTAVADRHGAARLEERDARLLAHLAALAGDVEAAERVLATGPLTGRRGELVGIDLANPWLRDGLDEATWLARLNSRLYDGLVPATLLPDGPTPFDRLTAGGQPVTHPARITVIMSCFNPGAHLLTAVRSVLEQTWQNVELIVVDDASPAPAPGVLEAVERMDPRVRLVRKAVNGGTYRARNTALRLATGDFFTCLDSDDWAHPQRLELGVEPLLRDPRLIASRGVGVRATEHLELSRIGYSERFTAASSLMVRRFPALNRLGFFDPVRKGADGEYARRIETVYGGRIHRLPSNPLTVLLADERSLSAGDFSSGWRHPARAEYEEAQEHWHAQVARGDRTAFVEPDGPRAFPAPRRWQRHPQDGGRAPELDLCLVADWREGSLARSTVAQLEEAVARGLRVGVVHLESLHDMRPVADPLAPVVRALVQRGAVERVYLDDARRARLVVVADPRPLQFPALTDVHLEPAELWVVPDEAAAHAAQYSPAAVAAALGDMFRVAPSWGPLSRLPLPAPAPAPAAAPQAPVTLTLPACGPPVADGAEVRSHPLREPADGAHAARLTVVGRAPVSEDVAALLDAWPGGPGQWAAAATRWLAGRPTAWCVVVQSGAGAHVLAGDGTVVTEHEPALPAVLRLAPGRARSRLLTFRRPAASPVR